jgi:ribosome recycling factor
VVLEATDLSKTYGDKVLFKDLSFKLPPNGIVGVIGPNGAGKSTLFRIITGQEQPDEGTFRLGETVKLAYVDQSRDALDPNKTVWQEVSGGLDILAVGKREINTRAYVGSFNFKGGDQQKKVGQLSGGERNRVHLAKTLTTGGNVTLGTVNVPEPRMVVINVWDKAMIGKIEKAIRESGIGINPVTDGPLIRLPIPELNEQRRKELTKVAAQYAESAKVAIRNVRRDGMDQIKKAKAAGMSEDDQKMWSDEVQEMTDKQVAAVDKVLDSKQAEIMQI